MRSIDRIVAWIAGVGWLCSLLLHIAALLDHPAATIAYYILIGGVFFVWLPAILQLLASRGALRGLNAWRWLLEGSPLWMQLLAASSFVYASVNFWAATGVLAGEVTSQDPSFARVVSGHALAFYGVALVIMWAASKRPTLEPQWVCQAGHEQPPGTLRCRVCGATVSLPGA
jgi:hypothetical protein